MEKLQRPFDIVEVKKVHNLVAACQLFVYNFLDNNNKRIYFPTQLKTCLDLSQSFFAKVLQKEIQFFSSGKWWKYYCKNEKFFA